MDSAPPTSSPDVEFSGPILVNQGIESDRRGGISETSMHCLAIFLLIWCLVAILMMVGVYGPYFVRIGPNTSILVEQNSIFVKGIKVMELENLKLGLQLFGFISPPPLDVYMNWSESRLSTISHNSYKVWHYYLNKGTSLNISFSVKPQGSSVQFVVDEGKQGISESLNDPAFRKTVWSWNLIQGSGMIEMKINKSSSYYLAVANLKSKDVKVELDIHVRAVLYDTKKSLYNCTFSNGECTINAMSLVGNSVVLTSPTLSQGASIKENEWYIRFSYQPRWIAYVISTVIVICLALVVIQFCQRLLCFVEKRYLSFNDSARTPILANTYDDGLVNDDADLQEYNGNEGEARNINKRLCAICWDAPIDCFFIPCGHCISCYKCGTRMEKTAGSCPVCRRKMKKVKRTYAM
ncbi:E3 ubiquitin-protein ligase APD1 [Cardamine amara subsp. amara]|uniref:RING-type E3 ubiquitin transferase n=1 Tax=Cardamine amara subsp. amara TaxID=228776 RepID=A0ABD0ZGK9_CARAN